MTEHGSKLAIGALARRSECSIDTIRYYERMDLLPDVPRGSGGHRHYGNEHVRRLRFIRRARQLGLTLAEVRDLVARITRHSNDCRAMRALLKGHAQGVSRKIGELRQLEATLDQLLHACGDAELADCRLVEDLLTGDAVGPAAVCCSDGTASRPAVPIG